MFFFLLAGGLSLIFGMMRIDDEQRPMAPRVADRVHVLSRGQIVRSCTSAELCAERQVPARHLEL